ncbi:MAG: hypothetical protein RLZZ431_1088, partial [Bacteroidota bacterium]
FVIKTIKIGIKKLSSKPANLEFILASEAKVVQPIIPIKVKLTIARKR